MDNVVGVAYTYLGMVMSDEAQESKSVRNSLSLYPNPFNPTVTISIDWLRMDSRPEIRIYNLKGELIQHLPGL